MENLFDLGPIPVGEMKINLSYNLGRFLINYKTNFNTNKYIKFENTSIIVFLWMHFNLEKEKENTYIRFICPNDNMCMIFVLLCFCFLASTLFKWNLFVNIIMFLFQTVNSISTGSFCLMISTGGGVHIFL